MTPQILVPLDGSPLAEAALAHAMVLARATDSALHLLRTVVPINTLGVVTWPMAAPAQVDRWIEAERTAAQAYLALVAAEVEAADLAVTTTVSEGTPAERIRTLVAADPTLHMIVMASHGRRGLQRWAFGSIAEQVIQAVAVPVLVVPVHLPEVAAEIAQARPPFDRDRRYATILVPLDGSAFAEQALDPARRLAERCDASLVLVAVLPGLDDLGLAGGGIVPLWTIGDQQHARQTVAAYLATTVQRLAADRTPVRTRAVDGAPATMITTIATDEHADLIVMATHGRSGLSRFWLGSVATQVLRQTERPVLLIPAAAPHD